MDSKKSGRPDTDQSISKSIIKALTILDQFAKSDEFGIKELSENTTIPASTVQRIVNSLVRRQYLAQNTANLKYRLGLSFFNISSRYSNSKDWVNIAVTRMEKLASVYNETVNLAVLQGENIVLLAKVDSPHILRPNFNMGKPYPAINSAIGRCLIAGRPEEEIKRLIMDIRPNTTRSITDPERMRKELEKIRKNGYAIEDEEFYDGLLCVGAPILDAQDKVIAAVSISIPKIRLNMAKLPLVTEQIRETARQISMDLRGRFDLNGVPALPIV
ncbi:IclR family transcriptional regulator [Spirochaetia bacterium]|nr:IclR family transcriptional regulator [Spirochaetia bacterium]